MERSLAHAASHSRPICFNHGLVVHTRFQIPTCTATSSGFRSSRKSRKSITVKAEQSFTARQSISSNWDVSNFSSRKTTLLPRFEDLNVTDMLLRQRIVYLGTQVDDMSADLCISQLLFLDAEDPTKDIKLLINSPGGSITAGLGIYDAMKMCKADISTVCMGLAASMGAFVLATGTKGKRFCMPNARVMIHQPRGSVGGSLIDCMIRTREMMYHKTKTEKIFSRVTGKPEEEIDRDTQFDNFMNAWEAKEYGLVDMVIDDGKPGLVAPIAEKKPPPKVNPYNIWKSYGMNYKTLEKLPSEHNLLKKRDTEQEAAAPPL